MYVKICLCVCVYDVHAHFNQGVDFFGQNRFWFCTEGALLVNSHNLIYQCTISYAYIPFLSKCNAKVDEVGAIINICHVRERWSILDLTFGIGIIGFWCFCAWPCIGLRSFWWRCWWEVFGKRWLRGLGRAFGTLPLPYRRATGNGNYSTVLPHDYHFLRHFLVGCNSVTEKTNKINSLNLPECYRSITVFPLPSDTIHRSTSTGKQFPYRIPNNICIPVR